MLCSACGPCAAPPQVQCPVQANVRQPAKLGRPGSWWPAGKPQAAARAPPPACVVHGLLPPPSGRCVVHRLLPPGLIVTARLFISILGMHDAGLLPRVWARLQAAGKPQLTGAGACVPSLDDCNRTQGAGSGVAWLLPLTRGPTRAALEATTFSANLSLSGAWRFSQCARGLRGVGLH